MKMKKIVILVASVVAISSIISMTACDQVNKIPGAENVTSMAQGLGETAKSWGMTAKDWADAGINNIKESAMKQINSEVDKFMEENNIPKDKADEVMKLAKDWAKTALTASGEIDKAKGSLKQYLSDHLDDLEVSEDSSQASKNKK